MKQLVREKAQAILLRREGCSYKEILERIDVSKSSLSLWLRDLPLTEREIKFLKKRRIDGMARGRVRAATTLHERRIVREKLLFIKAKNDFVKFSSSPLFRVGIALYWAEGSKRDSGFAFVNSDPAMIRYMCQWIDLFLGIPRASLKARLFIHRPYAHEGLESFWSDYTGIPASRFNKTIYKPTGVGVKKRPNYKGCLRIVGGGIVALRTVQFWINLLIDESHKE